MSMPTAREWRQAAVCLSCAIVGWIFSAPYEGTEFSGGRVTGPLFTAFDNAMVLYAIAGLSTFVSRRAAAVIALVAAPLALPMYLLAAAPGPARRVIDGLFGGQWKTSLTASFVWNPWSAAGIVLVVVASFVCARSMKKPHAP